MSIPVAFTSFKSAGTYRVVYDRSVILNEDTQILRLVVGYSPQGPFNTPVYVKSISEFKALFGEPSKSLEKRGVYFHRIALQALLEGPILCLNLKRFSTETVTGATVDTTFNPILGVTELSPIDVVELNVEDIYDTTRFWELSAFKLADITDVNGRALDGYISLAATNTKNTSTSFFLRKASGQKVSAYNITVNDWYKDSGEEVPEFLQDKLNNKMSDFFAEIYFFKGEFTPAQVLTSDTLKNYFMSVTENGEQKLVLRPFVRNAYGEPVDTLDALFSEPSAGGLNHYIGCLIPYFKDKQGVYQALDIKVNDDVDTNNVMMNFNTDMLEEGQANIDLSGRSNISGGENGITLGKLFAGTATSTLLGNANAPVITDVITFAADYQKATNSKSPRRLTGNFYAESVERPSDMEDPASFGTVVLKDLKFCTGTIDFSGDVPVYTDPEGNEQILDASAAYGITLKVATKYWNKMLNVFGITEQNIEGTDEYVYNGGLLRSGANTELLAVPTQDIVAITNYVVESELAQGEMTLNFVPTTSWSMSPVGISASATQANKAVDGVNALPSVYGSSVSFIPQGSFVIGEVDGSIALISDNDSSLAGLFAAGDCILSSDTDSDGNLNNVYVQETGNDTDAAGVTTFFVKLNGTPLIYETGLKKIVVLENSVPGWEGKVMYIPADAVPGATAYQLYDSNRQLIPVWVTIDGVNAGIYDFTSYGDAEKQHEYATGKAKVLSDEKFLVRVDNALNQEAGTIAPVFLEGYTYQNAKPASTSMYDKQKWQDFILSTLTDYKGIRTGLLNKADIDYRYVVDSFESFVAAGCKNVLSFLCKEKESAFALLNFPSIRTFVKCPYTSFTDNKGIFNPEYVVNGFNPKKSHTVAFTLPGESDGASFCGFFTALKFSDGSVDSFIPSAGLVSNLFVEKYRSRQPYYIVAGPNYGSITASGMVGPDYNFSRDELNILEPYGVNCMVYRPGFGTFINANQTAKQTPKSALSSINVRELVIFLQDEVEKLLQSYQWEFNNQTVRNKIKDKADVICARIKGNGGILDFVNVMDESNNTPEIIDNEMSVLSTHIEPGRGMGKMIHELTIYRTGYMRAAISEA